MNVKTFISKDKAELKKNVSSFLAGADRVSVLNVKYDVDYNTKEYRAMVYYLKKHL